jgi:site-specific recombinase XerC
LETPKIIGETKIYSTGDIRCKGKGKTGKVRRLQIDEDAVFAIKKWLQIRGDDNCEFLFRESRATSMIVEQGKDIKTAQKLLGHLSSTTTEIYVIREDKDDSDEAFT